MGEFGAFRAARRPRCVEHGRHIVAVPLRGFESGRRAGHERAEGDATGDRRGRRGIGADDAEFPAPRNARERGAPGLAAREFVGSFEAEKRDGARILEQIGDLVGREQNVHGQHGRAGLEDAEIGHGEPGQIGAAQRDDVAGADPCGGEPAGDARRRGVKGAPRGLPAREDQRGLVRRLARRGFQSGREIVHRWGPPASTLSRNTIARGRPNCTGAIRLDAPAPAPMDEGGGERVPKRGVCLTQNRAGAPETREKRSYRLI